VLVSGNLISNSFRFSAPCPIDFYVSSTQMNGLASSDAGCESGEP
jgi:hypothetical protein